MGQQGGIQIRIEVIEERLLVAGCHGWCWWWVSKVEGLTGLTRGSPHAHVGDSLLNWDGAARRSVDKC